MNERLTSLLVYSAKCVAGCLAVFILASVTNFKDLSWSLISVMLVLSPDGRDSVNLALTRIKANVVGAAFGTLCLLIAATNMWMISISIVMTLSVCYFLKLDAGIRSAIAATIIIMLHEEGKHVWTTAVERIVAVLAGCVLGLIITFIFHFKNTSKQPVKANAEQEA
ncbi:MAG TPA: FUSC family protein [Ferruginibacter sp.]|nr:FUSC family protein [Ferruginibacter sp.]